jgi:hypothetical protein
MIENANGVEPRMIVAANFSVIIPTKSNQIHAGNCLIVRTASTLLLPVRTGSGPFSVSRLARSPL